jgi:methylated-DNA-[protein]-cysteine S-methyltransferase
LITNNKKIVFKSKFGNIRIISVEEKITSLNFTKSNLYPSSSDFLNKAKIQIEEYILGIRDQFSLSLNLIGTDFQLKVWNQLQLIPYGETYSYLKIAKILNTSPRAIGNACGKNPILIIIPCHRVIAVNGNLTGFSALGGIETKKRLLQNENL